MYTNYLWKIDWMESQFFILNLNQIYNLIFNILLEPCNIAKIDLELYFPLILIFLKIFQSGIQKILNVR